MFQAVNIVVKSYISHGSSQNNAGCFFFFICFEALGRQAWNSHSKEERYPPTYWGKYSTCEKKLSHTVILGTYIVYITPYPR